MTAAVLQPPPAILPFDVPFAEDDARLAQELLAGERLLPERERRVDALARDLEAAELDAVEPAGLFRISGESGPNPFSRPSAPRGFRAEAD